MELKFKGIHKIVHWYNQKAKCPLGSIAALLEEIDKDYGESGMCCYELSSFASKSGTPEFYPYSCEITEEEIVYHF